MVKVRTTNLIMIKRIIQFGKFYNIFYPFFLIPRSSTHPLPFAVGCCCWRIRSVVSPCALLFPCLWLQAYMVGPRGTPIFEKSTATPAWFWDDFSRKIPELCEIPDLCSALVSLSPARAAASACDSTFVSKLCPNSRSLFEPYYPHFWHAIRCIFLRWFRISYPFLEN